MCVLPCVICCAIRKRGNHAKLFQLGKYSLVLFLGSKVGSRRGLISRIRSSHFFVRRILKLRQCGGAKKSSSRWNMKMTFLHVFSGNRKSYVESLMAIPFKKSLLSISFSQPAHNSNKAEKHWLSRELLRRLEFRESTLAPRITRSLLNILIRLGVQVLLKI